jgi:hypothetical protein
MRTVVVAVAGGILILACVGAGCAQAAEIRMLVSNAVKTSLEAEPVTSALYPSPLTLRSRRKSSGK